MPLNICQICSREFEAPTKRSKYCYGRCFKTKEARYSCARYETFSAERKRASNLVQTAIHQGRLTRQPCEVCGKRYVVAHHDDYAAPLDVRWLCRPHHRKHHHQNGPGRNAFRAEGVSA